MTDHAPDHAAHARPRRHAGPCRGVRHAARHRSAGRTGLRQGGARQLRRPGGKAAAGGGQHLVHPGGAPAPGAAVPAPARRFRCSRPARRSSSSSRTSSIATGPARRRRHAAGAGRGACRAWAPASSSMPSGLVVTNNHVIDGADEITVTLQDNTVAEGQGGRPRRDRRHRPAAGEDRQAAAGGPVRRFRRRAGRRLGAGDRQPVRPGRHGDRRHRLGARPRHPARGRTTTSSRPTPRSTAATPAARCSTWTAR